MVLLFDIIYLQVSCQLFNGTKFYNNYLDKITL